MQQRLYAVVAKVVPDGIVVAKPIFQTIEKEEYFGFSYGKTGNRTGIEQVDVTRYGVWQFLPISRRILQEGEEQLIVWQKTKCLQYGEGLLNVTSAIGNNLAESWLKLGIFVGIGDNQHFILTKIASTAEEMQRLYR